MSTTYPSKDQYEKAVETVKEYEARQVTIERLKGDLKFHLNKFTEVKFKSDKKSGRVIFAGLLKDSGRLLQGQSTLSNGDKWNATIGKLIAVMSALDLDVEEVLEHVETKPVSSWLTYGVRNFDSGGIRQHGSATIASSSGSVGLNSERQCEMGL